MSLSLKRQEYLRDCVSEPDSKEVHLLAVKLRVAASGAGPVTGVGPGLDTASVEAALAARSLTLKPVLGDGLLAYKAQRQWPRGQER